MKYLYLLRHAHAEMDRDDFQRSLSPRGMGSAASQATAFANHTAAVDAIITSSARRAKQTATLFAERLAFATTEIAATDTLYNCEPQAMLSELVLLAPSIDRVLLVGHNPAITICANELSISAVDEFSPASLVGLRFAIDDWQSLATHSGETILSLSAE